MKTSKCKSTTDIVEPKIKNAMRSLRKAQTYAFQEQTVEKWLRKRGLKMSEVDGEQFLALLYEDDYANKS